MLLSERKNKRYIIASTNYATKFSTMLSARLSTQIAQTENSRLWDYTQSLLRITTCTMLRQQLQ